MTTTREQVDVRLTEMLDGVVLVGRRDLTALRLSRSVRATFPGVRLRRVASGLFVGASDVDRLLDGDGGLHLDWSPDALQFAQNRAWAKRERPRLLADLSVIREGGRPVAERRLRDVAGLEVLDDHQWTNVAAMTIANGFGLCVFDEQGAGKTVTLIHAFDALVKRDEADFVLIVAPKSMIAEWPRDFQRFKGDLYRVVIATGGLPEKRRVIRSGPDALVTNFETTVSMEQELRALLGRRRGRAILVVDESFFVKNLDAKRTKAIRRLREWCGRAFVLCGTPAPNSAHDLVEQFNIVDFGTTFDGVVIPKDRQLAKTVVQARIDEQGLFIRHLKRDVLPNLPAKSFHRILLPMQPQQRSAYEAALTDLILDLRSTDDRGFHRRLTSFLARRAALLQICSHPGSIVPGYSEVPAKLLVLESLLQEFIESRGEKVVVWSFYTASIEAIVARFKRYSPIRYDGTIGDVQARRESVRLFQEDDDRRLMVANPAAAGAGLTLHRARLAVYESMSNQAAHYLQSLDRIHRRGQDRDVEYTILLCDGTIDVLEYEALVLKERASQELLRDGTDQPVSRATFLGEMTAALETLNGTQTPDCAKVPASRA